MHILTVLLIVASAHARFCGPYLMAVPGRSQAPLDPTTLTTAEIWLDNLLGEPAGLDNFLEEHQITRTSGAASLRIAAATYAIDRWQRWTETNQPQRDAAMGLELRKLIGPGESNVLEFDSNLLTTKRSRANRARLIARAEELFPLGGIPKPNVAARAKELSEQLSFHFLRRHTLKATGGYAPLASPAELRRFGLRERTESYYSQLVGGSPSVGFDLTVSRVGEPAFNLGGHLAMDALRLGDELASDSGFMLPHLNDPLDLLRLMAKWQPAALEKLAYAIRYSLPNSVRTGAELLTYAERTPALFGDPERLSPLRERLADFFMVEDDAETFLRHTFERYLLWIADRKSSDFQKHAREFRAEGGAQHLFARDFLPAIAWAGVSLRVPISVPASQFTIIRAEGAQRDPGWRFDSTARRLDRSYAP